MAALCPGVKYGLSSQQNFGENKDLIFVKLTDSALRAIDDYIRNQNKYSYQQQTPRIRFLGNENGELSFPSQSSSNGNLSFNFTMSDTQDMQGPAGSFECIQGGPKGPDLQSLGPIPYKIRVHANEDVYEATRNRMNEVEDKNKQKCTREIKPNQTDIGRKVKLKQVPGMASMSSNSARVPLVPPPQQQQQRPPMASMRDSLMKQTHPTSNNSYGSTNGKLPGSSYGGISAVHSSNLGGLSNGLGSNHVSSSQKSVHSSSNNKPKPSVPDIARRPLKERLIHMLALRPMKKIELHDRLNKEGVRSGNSMTPFLKQIAYMKDNCYFLNRNMWNEVQEDWPFYTETEKQVLKRRKPQNLTPPASDGSSGSGQSPTSTHPGSPPLITSTNSTTSVKRPGYSDGPDGLPYKRPRVAHGSAKYMGSNGAYGGMDNGNSYNRDHRQQTITPEPPYRQQADSHYNNRSPSINSRSPINRSPMNRSPIEHNNSQRRPVTDLRDSSNMNPRSRESPTTNGYFSNSNYDSGQINDDSDKKRQCDNLTYGVNRDKIFKSNGSPPIDSSRLMTEEARRGNNHLGSNNNQSYKSPQLMTNGAQSREKENLRKISNNVSSSNQNRVARVSPDSQTEISSFDISPKIEENGIKNEKMEIDEEDFPDYTKQYVTITNLQQRRNYKADFTADYAEYRDLHPVVEKVSRRFVELEERLRHEEKNSPKWKEIRRQIVKEYQENKQDLEHHRAKKRFTYLHAKLSHIKKLVNDFDQKAIAAC